MSQRWANGLVWAATIVLIVAVTNQAWAGNTVDGNALLNLLVFALPLAGIYAMSASGLVVVYTTTGIFNFAQGAIGMVMAYVDWQLVVKENLPQWLALPLVVLVIAPLFGVLLDRGIMRHLQGKPLVMQLMVTVGLMFALIGLAGIIWNQNDAHSLPALFGNKGFHIGDVILTWHRFITITLAIALAIGLRILLFRTRIGIAMRAVVDNRDLAALEGARSSVLSSFAWAIGCAMAALAGILLAPETGDMKTGGILTFVVITAISAAVVGRLRSLPLTYIGALILALAQTFVAQFLNFTGGWTNVADALPTIMLFIVLLLLPRANLEFARISAVRRIEKVSTVRDTALGMAALVAFMAILGSFLSDADIDRFSLGMCTALVALSLVPLTGWAGQVSLAPLAFAGIGATVYTRLGGVEGHWWAVVLAALITAPIGALLAFPAMRLRGLYLALLTLAFASMMEAVFYSQSWAIGPGHRFVQRLQILGYDSKSPKAFLILSTIVFGLCGIAVIWMRRGPFGRRLIALRDSEAASVTVGINVLITKVLVFGLSAGIAGFAGAFYVQRLGQIDSTPNNGFGMLVGLGIVLALVIGGVSFVAGALFAGLFGLFTQLISDKWHLSLWTTLVYLGPGFAVLGIIQNPSGAVVAIGEGFARLLPWRHDAKREYEKLKAENAEPEIGRLGIEEPFDEAAVLDIDRTLGVSTELVDIPVGVGE